jgi:flagellar basal body-associated protein FliL
MKTNRKGFSSILIIILIVVVLAVASYLAARKGSAPSTFVPDNEPSVTQAAPMQTSKDLDSASAELDSADISGLDTQLNQLNADISSF